MQHRDEHERLLGEGFGIDEVVEALRGKVEVERVVGRLMELRREVWCLGMGQAEDGGEGGEKGGKVHEAVGAD